MKIIDDLCKAKDGSWSLTKIAALVAHTLLSCAFAKITLTVGFVPDMWWIYAMAALGHAFADKTAAQVAAFKQMRLAAETVDVQQPTAPTGPV